MKVPWKSFEFEVNGNILDAKLYDTGIKEVMEKVTQDKAAMLRHSDQVFQNAQYLYSTPDYAGDPNVYRWNYFYAPVEIGEETVGVRIAIRDVAVPHESQIYNWGIKKDAALGGGGRGQNRIPTGASSSASSGATLDSGKPSSNASSPGASSVASSNIISALHGDVNADDRPNGVTGKQLSKPTDTEQARMEVLRQVYQMEQLRQMYEAKLREMEKEDLEQQFLWGLEMEE